MEVIEQAINKATQKGVFNLAEMGTILISLKEVSQQVKAFNEPVVTKVD